MNSFGFSFHGLYGLQVEELQDLARLIRGDTYRPPRTKDALIRGVIIPFMRGASKAPHEATKDEVMRIALIRVAKRLDIRSSDWEGRATPWIAQQVRVRFGATLLNQFDIMGTKEREEILRRASAELDKRAHRVRLSLLPVAAILSGELSGFGIYLATTQTLAALSSAIGLTFPWVVYQGATTALGAILGPVGWVLAGGGVLASGAAYIAERLGSTDLRLRLLVVSLALVLRDPYEWFGLDSSASLSEVKRAYRAMMKAIHPDRIEEDLPNWLKSHFGELLLRTLESYERIQQHQEEMR